MNLTNYVKAERGRGAEVANAIGVHPVMVSQWISDAKPVPPERCPAIERATKGAVTVEELRPDARWHRVPDEAWPGGRGRPLLDVASQQAAA